MDSHTPSVPLLLLREKTSISVEPSAAEDPPTKQRAFVPTEAQRAERVTVRVLGPTLARCEPPIDLFKARTCGATGLSELLVSHPQTSSVDSLAPSELDQPPASESCLGGCLQQAPGVAQEGPTDNVLLLPIPIPTVASPLFDHNFCAAYMASMLLVPDQRCLLPKTGQFI